MTIEVFVKKPEKVEVLKYDGTNYDEVVKFLGKQMCNLKCVGTNDYIVKFNNKITVTHDKPNFEKQELIGAYNKNAFQGVNPNVHMSLEKLQEFFEVPIVDDRKKGVDKIASNNNCGVKKYQKKLVEAVKCSRDNLSAIMEFTNGEGRIFYSSSSKRDVGVFYTHEKVIVADVGDYIVKDNKGEFYPCKPDVFEATYDVCK